MKKLLIIIGIIAVGLSVYIFVDALNKNTNSNLLDTESFLLIAHRGASAKAPEHTLFSYQLAKEMEADYIEIDLQMTKDGVLVALHDDSVDRTTNGSGKVAEMNLDEIKNLDAGSWFNRESPDKAKDKYEGIPIPTLEEILMEFGDSINYYIETKQPDASKRMEEELLRLLDQYELLDKSVPKGKVIIQSFSEKSLKTIHEMNDDIPLIQLTDNIEKDGPLQQTFALVSEYATGIGVSYINADKAYIAAAREAGLLVHSFTVDELEQAEKLKSLGVTGIFTNDIDALKSLSK